MSGTEKFTFTKELIEKAQAEKVARARRYVTAVPLCYKAVVLGKDGQIYSLYDASSWTADGYIGATCFGTIINWSGRRVHFHNPLIAPMADCNCGIYAQGSTHFLTTSVGRYALRSSDGGFFTTPNAVGTAGIIVGTVVEGLGRVEMHENGWRAEVGHIVAFMKQWTHDLILSGNGNQVYEWADPQQVKMPDWCQSVMPQVAERIVSESWHKYHLSNRGK